MTNRFRMWVTLSVLSLLACTSRSGVDPGLPKSVSPEWTLQSFTKDAEGWHAAYTGPGFARVRIRSIVGEAVGLDLVQNWRPRANTVVFYSARYFTIVEWSGASAAQARALVTALERAMK